MKKIGLVLLSVIALLGCQTGSTGSERATDNRKVPGSNPGSPTNYITMFSNYDSVGFARLFI